MTAIASSQFLRISDAAGTAWHRWQSFYAHRSVTLNGQPWLFQPFEASALTIGQTGDEGGVTLELPATPLTLDAAAIAMAQGHVFELFSYEFTPTGTESAPPSSQQLVAQFAGEIVNASANLTGLRLELGSSLAPVGAQIPPRTFTTRLMGKGCRL